MHGKGISSSTQHAPTVTMSNGEENQREQDEALHDPATNKDECMLPRYSPTFNNITTSGECLEQHIKADGQKVTGNDSLDSSPSQGRPTCQGRLEKDYRNTQETTLTDISSINC
ncbi:hypothetical protein L2E82_04474 [Cichorium intybus]|uniref:Uncharacterized protein n=1 Tax=Cichorium intybus TaxID=13427 RepID=A0ACB9H746_CICIN|nr:hypothetical protein L2E82_04474 [Cichorium intybus]